MYVELILPLAVEQSYHYKLEQNLFALSDSSTLVGRRAIVSFGRKRFYTGIIASVSTSLPIELKDKELKAIERILDERPIVSPEQLSLWQWMSSYYNCLVGQVMRLALPSGLMPESKTLIFLHEDYISTHALSEDEYRILDILSAGGKEGMTLDTLNTRLGKRATSAYLHLLQLGAIHTEETVICRYKPRLKAYLQLNESYRSEEGLALAFTEMKRAVKQQELLELFLSRLDSSGLGLEGLIPRLDISHGDSARSALIKKIVERGVWQLIEQAESRIANTPETSLVSKRELPTLVLPKGVTYLETKGVQSKELAIISLVKQYISEGKQVLLLSPSAHDAPNAEEYLTALAEASSQHLYYYHPQISEAKRTELYQHLSYTDEACLIIGTRSAVFLPLQKLGLIIVDEEHEYLYKQQYTAPLFHARDVALYLGAKRAVEVLLTSSTPSAETLFNTLRGKYHKLSLDEHSPTRLLPEIQTIEIQEAREKKQMPYGTSISPKLKGIIQQTLIEGRRVLLLQNRRGYAPYVQCAVCEQGITCPHCDVSLNYYSSNRLLRCHYCGHTAPMPRSCPNCGESQIEHKGQTKPALRLIGYGSERIEEEVSELFPEARILRIDSDSLQSASRRAEVHERIKAGDVDIIVGTQLIKGQPLWDNVGLIGVVQLDAILGYPDFRSGERAYQLLYQLMLRSSSQDCKLVVQTANADNPFLLSLKQKDYHIFIQHQLAERQIANFPPFCRLSIITMKGFSEEQVVHTAESFVLYLRQHLAGISVSDVQEPSVARIDGQYIREIVCRRPYSMSYSREREGMVKAEAQLRHFLPECKRVQIIYNIDPL